jgi:hypothetical protein
VDIRSKAQMVVAWPFENVIQPVFGMFIMPIRPPLDYIMDEKVIDRAVSLITMGERNNIMLYPTYLMAPGTESMIGFTYRHQDFTEYSRDQFYFNAAAYVNADWSMTTRYQKDSLFSTAIGGYLRLNYREDRDALITAPHSKQSYLYGDSSMVLTLGLSRPLTQRLELGLSSGIYFHRYDTSSIVDSVMVSGTHSFFDDVAQRGMYQNFNEIPLAVSFSWDSRSARHTATSGTDIFARYTYSIVNPYFAKPAEEVSPLANDFNHDYHNVEFRWQRYFLIGKQRYELTGPEVKANKKFLNNFNLKDAVDLVRPNSFRQTFLERKVIVVQARMAHMWEVEQGGAPFTALNTLGNSTPLRGYSGNPFSDYTVYALSMEYRWPLIRMVDGVFFNEYGVTAGEDLQVKDWSTDLKNSWGFGVRIAKPNLFLTRFQLGFHGTQGIVFNLTIRPAY